MYVLIRWILALSLLLTSPASGAGPLRLEDGLNSLSIGRSVQVLEDPDRSLTLTDILRPEHQARFRLNQQAIPNYGFTPSAHWFKVDVINTRTVQAEWYLEVEDTMQFGSACEAMLLSLALAARLRTLQREKDEAWKHLVQKEKMANLGLLTAGISHEIKNPAQFLTLGAANVESRLKELQNFIADLTNDDPDAELNEAFNTRFDGLYKQLGVVKEGSDRIQAIIQGMRHASRQDESGPKTLFDPVKGLLATVELVKPTWKTSIDFDVSGLTEGTLVMGYGSALNQVFTNLLVNGCQAIEERQKTAARDFTGNMTLHSHNHESELVITIEDNGCGMSPETRQRIFEPFFTTKDSERGTGLGMGICAGILQDHGGRLEIESTLGEGSRMTIHLPRHVN